MLIDWSFILAIFLTWIIGLFSNFLQRWDLKVGQMLLSPPESVVTCVQQGGRCVQDYGHFDVHVVVPENVHDDHEDVDNKRKPSFPPGPEFVSHQDSSNTRWDFQNLCAQFQWPIKDFAIDSENDFPQVVWPNRGGGFGKISLSHNWTIVKKKCFKLADCTFRTSQALQRL